MSAINKAIDARNRGNTRITGTGSVGPAGPQGPQGPAGIDGIDGINGTNGIDGLTAYEIAVANGFTGTIEEWLGSLVGATGATGPKGDTGDTGPQGLQGEQGIQGLTGDTGPAGADGINGTDGISFTWKGEWSPTVQYYTNDVVNVLGAESVIAIATPPIGNISGTYWDLMAPKGDTGPAGADGIGIPTGGTTGQALVKNSNTDYDTEWATITGGGGYVGDFDGGHANTVYGGIDPIDGGYA